MAVRKIILFPEESLYRPCIPVEDFKSKEFVELVEDLKDTARAYRAQGLAASQIAGNLRVFVSKVDSVGYKVFVNPKLELDGDLVRNHEGCLSLPGATVLVERPEECTVTFQDEEGKESVYCVDDRESVAIQHETDHLDGKLMIEHLTRLEKRMFLKKVSRYKKKYLGGV